MILKFLSMVDPYHQRVLLVGVGGVLSKLSLAGSNLIKVPLGRLVLHCVKLGCVGLELDEIGVIILSDCLPCDTRGWHDGLDDTEVNSLLHQSKLSLEEFLGFGLLHVSD